MKQKYFFTLLLFAACVVTRATEKNSTSVDVKGYNLSDSTIIQVYRKKQSKVRLSPNPTYNGTLTVRSASTQPVHFYVFDVEGTLMYHALLNQNEKQTVSQLKKGEYLYDVFHKDESVEQGKIIVK